MVTAIVCSCNTYKHPAVSVAIVPYTERHSVLPFREHTTFCQLASYYCVGNQTLPVSKLTKQPPCTLKQIYMHVESNTFC